MPHTAQFHHCADKQLQILALHCNTLLAVECS